MDRAVLVNEVRRYITRLKEPLSQSDAVAGWEPANRADAIMMFIDLENNLVSGELPKPSLIRTLDSWGMAGGDLLRKAAEIEIQLSALSD